MKLSYSAIDDTGSVKRLQGEACLPSAVIFSSCVKLSYRAIDVTGSVERLEGEACLPYAL